MASWDDFRAQRPELAALILQRFEEGRDHLLATLRRDGSPRLSAVEVVFLDGDVQLGMVAGSRKIDDVRRDPRAALHAATLARAGDRGWPGDAKIAGRVVEHPERLDPSFPDAAQMTFDLHEATFTRVDDATGALVVDSWRAPPAK